MSNAIPILMYHLVAQPPPVGTPWRSMYVTPDAFHNQMMMLKRLGYACLSIGQLVPYLKGEKSGRVIGLTFDDGFESNLLEALPVLKEAGFTATCYVVSSLVGKTNEWDHASGAASARLMTLEQLSTWKEAGMEIGAHSVSHQNLKFLDSEQCRDEIKMPELLGACHHFCYPYGSYSHEHMNMVMASGYLTATTTVETVFEHGKFDLLELPRIGIYVDDTIAAFLLKVVTPYLRTKHLLKNHLKRLIRRSKTSPP